MIFKSGTINALTRSLAKSIRSVIVKKERSSPTSPTLANWTSSIGWCDTWLENCRLIVASEVLKYKYGLGNLPTCPCTPPRPFGKGAPGLLTFSGGRCQVWGIHSRMVHCGNRGIRGILYFEEETVQRWFATLTTMEVFAAWRCFPMFLVLITHRHCKDNNSHQLTDVCLLSLWCFCSCRRIMTHSESALDDNYSSLVCIDVRDCRASRPEDWSLHLELCKFNSSIDSIVNICQYAWRSLEAVFQSSCFCSTQPGCVPRHMTQDKPEVVESRTGTWSSPILPIQKLSTCSYSLPFLVQKGALVVALYEKCCQSAFVW